MTVPLAQQIAEVERELALRTNVYPGQVRRKKMRQAEADKHIANMQAVLKTLRWLAGHGIPPDMPRPADMIAALVHVRQTAHRTTAGDLGAGAMREKLDEIVRVVEDVLTGIPVPVLKEEADAARDAD